jgi:hypothetical protein
MDPLFCKIHIVQNLRPKLTGAGVLGCLLLGALAWAGDKPGYKDIYLTQERVCRACTWAWESRTQVRLTNRLGHSTLVKPEEIIGIDRHPVLRKLTLKSLHGIGLPGPIIVPAAFEDANDYVCKYCDAFH